MMFAEWADKGLQKEIGNSLTKKNEEINQVQKKIIKTIFRVINVFNEV